MYECNSIEWIRAGVMGVEMLGRVEKIEGLEGGCWRWNRGTSAEEKGRSEGGWD